MPYEPLTIYDAPGVMVNQLYNGTFAPGDTLISPMDLSPIQRESIATRLKDAAGRNKVSNALIDVAMNPWTWLLFVTSPIGEKAGTDLFKMAQKYTLTSAERVPMLGAVGALTSSAAIRGSRTEMAVYQAERGMREINTLPSWMGWSDEYINVLERNNLKEHELNWKKYRSGSPEQQAAKAISYALQGDAQQWHQVVSRSVPVLDAETNTLKNVIQEVQPVAGINPREVLDRYGASRLADQTRLVLSDLKDKVFSDPKAKLRLFSSLSRNVPDNQLTGADLAGKAMIKSLLGDAVDVIQKGDMTVDDFTKMLDDIVGKSMADNQSSYFPLNQVEELMAGQKTKFVGGRDIRTAATLRATNATATRQKNAVVWGEEELEDIKEILGAGPGWQQAHDQTQAVINASIADNRSVIFHKVRPVDAMTKHVDGLSRTYAMFVQDIGEGVRSVDRSMAQAGEQLSSWNKPELARHRKNIVGLDADVKDYITKVEGTGLEPMGGFTIADVLYADHAVAKTDWHRDTISKIIIPRLMGKLGTDSMLKLSAVVKSKQLVQSFLDTGIAGAIGGSGKFGADFIERMKTFASSTDNAFEEGMHLQNFLTKAIYVAHLGINIPSAMINMTQPFIYAGSWGGYDNVAKGYASAFKELGDYYQLRMAEGFKPLSTIERAERIKKTHKFANWEGQDLLEIAGDTMDTLEGKLHASIKSQHTVKSMASRALFEFPMALFQQGEIINRNVAAHTAFAAATKRGVTESWRVGNEVRNLVRETQFGSHWLNTPQMFMPEAAALGAGGKGLPTGRLFANPLIRQFMGFPLRSFTAAVYTSPKLAGREGFESFKGFLNDTARGMAMSAIGYELAKNLIGTDISRAGYAAAATDILPGFSGGRTDVKDAESPLPLPPAIDIPLDIVRGILGSDADLISKSIPRLLPGGVALSRALSGAPDLGPVGFVLGQTRYTDWNNIDPDGNVAVMDSQQNLIGYENATALIMKSTGFDISGFKEQGDLSKYLASQSENIATARRDYMRMMTNGQSEKAEAMAQQFEKKFKVPLTVTKAQWDQFAKLREVPRLDRQLQRMPEATREAYAAYIQPTGGFDSASEAFSR